MKKQYKNIVIEDLINGLGGGIAIDKISVDGANVAYMYRESTNRELDSGWRFLAGSESQAYMDDACNMDVFDINTIANYDRTIIPYLNSIVDVDRYQ